MNREDIFQQLRQILADNFEIPPSDIQLESDIYDDLDMDSIDAVDLVVHIQGLTGTKVKPQEFKAARTVNDVIDIVCKLMPPQLPQ